MPPSPNVLVVRFSSIGDVLLITPLLRAIRARHPEARITVLTKQAFAPLLERNPHVNRVLTLAPGGSLRAIAAELRAAQFSHRLDLHGSLRSRLLRLLVPGRWGGYPKHRVARGLLVATKRNLYRDRRPVPERYFDAARELDVRPDGGPPELEVGQAAAREAAAWLADAGLKGERPVVALAPGAAHATKRWPPGHWTKLAARMVEANMDVVLVGGPDDVPIAEALVAAGPAGVQSAAGQFGLEGTAALLARCRALVSGDTGVMHMATAVGTPVVALFGPTVEAFGFFPYTGRADVVQLDLDCRPCSTQGSRHCPLGHHRCLRAIPAEDVFARLCEALA